MANTPVPRIDIGSINLGGKLGTGGQGSVTAVNHFLIDRQWNAVVKVYSAAAATMMRPAVLEKIVGYPRQIGAEDRHWLYAHTAWPAVIAEDNGAVCGFLMREVPPAYYFGFQTQTRGIQPKLSDLAFLLNPDNYIARSGLSVTDQGRVGLLIAIAETISRLHALDIVIGDLSPKNLLFSLAGMPSCFLIDCDTARLHGETVLDAADTPDWEPPGLEPKATPATDAYKFALLAIRLFARDQSSRDLAALTALSPWLGNLAERGLSSDPAQRPHPADWLPALRDIWPSAAAAPVALAPVALAAPPVRSPAPAVALPLPPVTVAADPVTSPAPVSQPTAAPPDRRRTTKAILGVAALFLVITAITAAVVVTRHPSGATASGAPTGGARYSATARATAASTAPAWTTFQDPGEFSIMLPPGWTESSDSSTEVDFTGSPPGYVALVAWTTHPKPDALTDWEQQAAAKAQIDPTYQQIAIQRVDYRGYNAADWQFINVYQGVRTRVIDRGFIVVPGQLGYAIELYGPVAGFPAVYASIWNGLVTSFEPGS